MPTLPAVSWRRIAYPGLASGLVSVAALLWRGHRDLDRPLAPVNAPSHWLWGDAALRQPGASLRYTGIGASTHLGSAALWAALYDLVRRRRARPTPRSAAIDALAVTGIAALVDLVIVPKRLTPGFERQLSGRSLVWFYAAFAAGLAVGGAAAQRGR